MRYILFILLITSIYSANADNIRIVTSTNHLASIANMIVRDTHDITVISNTGACPEHYHLKPSDMERIKNADLVIYIDGKFENFIENILPAAKKNILKISSINDLYVRDNNWHIWLDLYNVKLILKDMCNKLSEIDPAHRKTWKNNLEKSLKELVELESYRNRKFANLQNMLLLSDSLEYIFRTTSAKEEKLYIYPGMATMHTLSKLSHISQSTCIIASNSENWAEFSDKISHKIITIDSEKWVIDHHSYPYYIEHYKQIIDIIERECHN